jgi:hypothetical protein
MILHTEKENISPREAGAFPYDTFESLPKSRAANPTHMPGQKVIESARIETKSCSMHTDAKRYDTEIR